MQQIKARLIYNTKVNHNCFCCGFHAPAIAASALPGQFVNIKISQTSDPLLRRPFSIHRVKGSAVEILYEVVGKASSALSQKKPQELLDIIGPLGKGFDYWSQSHKVIDNCRRRNGRSASYVLDPNNGHKVAKSQSHKGTFNFNRRKNQKATSLRRRV